MPQRQRDVYFLLDLVKDGITQRNCRRSSGGGFPVCTTTTGLVQQCQKLSNTYIQLYKLLQSYSGIINFLLAGCFITRRNAPCVAFTYGGTTFPAGCCSYADSSDPRGWCSTVSGATTFIGNPGATGSNWDFCYTQCSKKCYQPLLFTILLKVIYSTKHSEAFVWSVTKQGLLVDHANSRV